MSSIIDLLAKNLLHRSVVSHKALLSPQACHIRLQSDSFKGRTYLAGEHLRLFVGLDRDTALNDKLRTYSIWGQDASAGTVELAVCTHSDGVGTRWAKEVKVGEEIYYMGPSAKLTIDHNADSYLLIGDDSALSHLYAIKRAIPANKRALGLVYASNLSDLFLDLDGSKPFRFLDLPPNPVAQLSAEIQRFKDQFSKDTIAYLAGDARTCREISRFLKNEMHWDSSRIRSRGFWMPGRTGMD